MSETEDEPGLVFPMDPEVAVSISDPRVPGWVRDFVADFDEDAVVWVYSEDGVEWFLLADDGEVIDIIWQEAP